GRTGDMTGADDRNLVLAAVDSAYAILEFEPGGEPDWTVGDELYSPQAVLALRVFPDDPTVSVLSWPQYKKAQMADNLGEHGYSETPGDREVQIIGDIALVHQHFTMNFRHRPPAAAVDVFGLVRHHGRWQIVSVLSDAARDQNQGDPQ
ncbi:MAG: hypothetical protein ACR2JI_02285, partial [Mycobacterium sp.]